VRQHDLGEVVVISRVEMGVILQITQAISSNQGAYWILVVTYRSGMMREHGGKTLIRDTEELRGVW
jgi:hypothetical protein